MESTFLRQEYKYPIQKEETKQFLKRVNQHIVPDTYPEYDLYNIYFDTESFETASYCQEKHAYKEKLRLRSYGRKVPEFEY